MNDFSSIPSLSEVRLLPDTHAMLAERQPVFDFTQDGADAAKLADLLTAAMLRFGGIGLAANQIGIPTRAFAMMMHDRPVVLFNPVLLELDAETVSLEEGCLTFPDLFLNIARPRGCRVIYHDRAGQRTNDVLDGWDARVAMHEIDHLDGVVFTSKASRLHLQMQRERLRKAKKKAARRK
ncbi:MAG: peptide deformylase [Oxalobacteraceae bacterium]|nr:MAG: peptide deformylase [Oxalobacteraceae bacterium]